MLSFENWSFGDQLTQVLQRPSVEFDLRPCAIRETSFFGAKFKILGIGALFAPRRMFLVRQKSSIGMSKTNRAATARTGGTPGVFDGRGTDTGPRPSQSLRACHPATRNSSPRPSVFRRILTPHQDTKPAGDCNTRFGHHPAPSIATLLWHGLPNVPRARPQVSTATFGCDS